MNTDTISAPAAETLGRIKEILPRLDDYALGVTYDRTLLALQIQEGTKADMLRRLTAPEAGKADAGFQGFPAET